MFQTSLYLFPKCSLVFFLLRAHSPSDSPDSVLKLKLCPPLNFFPNSSSSDRSDRSSSRSEYQDQRKQLLSSSSPPPRYTLCESHFGGSPSPTSAIEAIARSPDGRFVIQPDLENSIPTHIKKNLKREFPQSPGRGSNDGTFKKSNKSNPDSSERDGQRENLSALTVDPPDPERPHHSPGRVKAMARNFSRHGCFYSDDEQGCSEALLEKASFYSDCSEKRVSDSLRKCRSASHREDIFPSLTRRARALERERLLHQAQYQPINGDSQLTEDSTMVTQLDGERERDNLSKCLKLVKEREQMERELEHYTASRRVQAHEQQQRRAKSASPLRKWTGGEFEDPIWKPQDIHLRQKNRPSSLAQRVSDYRRGCYFGNTSSPLERLPSSSSSHIQWDISPVTSPTSLVPVQSLSEGNTPHSLYPHTRQQGIADLEDSLATDVSRSPATQYTSLSLFSPTRDISSPSKTNLSGAQARHPESHLEEEQELPNRTLVQESWLQERKMEKEAPAFRSTSPARLNPQTSELHQMVAGRDRDTSPNRLFLDPMIQSVTDTEEVRAVQKDKLSHNPSGCSTLPYDHQKVGAKGKVIVSGDSSSILPYNEQEKEGIRARSRKSDKCVLSESPSRISHLTLLENEAGSDQNLSLSRMSESMKAKLAPQPDQMSPLQTSTILEYLSLPGFIEMSVDDPAEVTEPLESVEPSVEPETRALLRDEPDVVPKIWEKDGQEHSISHHNGAVHDHRTLNVPVAQDTCVKSGISNTIKKGFSPSKEKEKSSEPLVCQSLGPQKQEVTQHGQAQTLINTAKTMAAIVSKCPDSISEQYQRYQAQGDRTNMISSRIYPGPMPFMKKSVSIGPCRTLSGVGQPRQFLKKSISLGSRWEHFENPRAYISETCYRDKFPHPDIRLKSYSLGRTPARYYPMSGPSWRGSVPCQPPTSYSLERRKHIERSDMTPPYHAPVPSVPDPPQHMESSLPSRRESDPRRQAAVFQDISRWPLTYQETLRSVQHKYVPQEPPRPFVPPRSVARVDYLQPAEHRRYPPRPFLPRGYSWPSPYHTSFPLREQDIPREVDKGMGAVRGCTETEGRDIRGDGGRASYASQSSGRGSVGPYGHGHLRQSLSITPTLLSSPETTEESERLRTDKDLRERRSKR